MSVSFHSNPWRNVAVGLASHSNRRDTHIIMSHHVSSCSDLRACSPISCANMWPVLLRWWSGGGVYECILSFKPMEECCCRFGLSFEPPRHAYHHVSSCLIMQRPARLSPISCANMWPVLLRWWSGGGVYECILSFKPMEECCCRFGLSFEPPRHAYHHVSSCLIMQRPARLLSHLVCQHVACFVEMVVGWGRL